MTEFCHCGLSRRRRLRIYGVLPIRGDCRQVGLPRRLERRFYSDRRFEAIWIAPLLEDILHEDDRFAIMIDGANLYQSARALGFDIDYRLLLDTFAGCARLVRACYYTALLDDQEYSPIRPLVDWLDYNGYSVVTKPLKEFTDASGRRKFKGNMDIELASIRRRTSRGRSRCSTPTRRPPPTRQRRRIQSSRRDS